MSSFDFEAWALTPPDEQNTICDVTLGSPVKHGGEPVHSIRFGPFLGAHARFTPEKLETNEDVLELSGQLTGLPPSFFNELEAEDFGEVIRATLRVSWPVLDMPQSWEAVEERKKPGERREMPRVEAPFHLTLEKEVESGPLRVSVLEFGKFTGAIARQCPAMALPVRQHPWLIEKLTDQPKRVIDRLEGKDLWRAMVVAQLFFWRLRATGERSRPSSPGASGGGPASSLDSARTSS